MIQIPKSLQLGIWLGDQTEENLHVRRVRGANSKYNSTVIAANGPPLQRLYQLRSVGPTAWTSQWLPKSDVIDMLRRYGARWWVATMQPSLRALYE